MKLLAGKPKQDQPPVPQPVASTTEKAKPDAEISADETDSALNLSRLTAFNEQCIGRLVAVYWEKHGLWYDGVVKGYDSGAGKHSVLYSDNTRAWASLRTKGRFLSDNAEGDALVKEQRRSSGITPKGPKAFEEVPLPRHAV
jgi:hypothetical protein